jgi:tetratricopeptide (TPR) repeat protein
LHQYADGHRYARLAAAILERLGDDGGEPAASLAMAVGVLDYAEDNLDDAASEFRRALAIREKLTPQDPSALAVTYTDLGNVASSQGDVARAIELHQRATSLFEVALGPHHPLLAQALSNLAVAQKGAHHDRDALASSERAVAIYEAAVEPGHRGLTISLTNLGDAYRGLGDLDKAIAAYERALGSAEKGGPEQEEIVELGLSQAEAERGNFARALELAQRSLQQRLEVLGRSDISTGRGMLLVATELINLKRADEAERYLADAEDVMEHAGGAEERMGIVYDTYGDLRLLQKRPAEAVKAYEHALSSWTARRHEDQVGHVPALLGLGRAWLELEHPDRALGVLERAYTLTNGPDVPEVDRASVAFPLASAIWATGGDRARARQLAAGALTVLDQSQAHHDEVVLIRAWLASHP